MAIVSDYTAILAYLDNDTLRWNGMTAVGAPVIVTYSFVESADLPDLADSNYNVSSCWSFSEVQREYFRQVAAQYEAVAGIILVEVTGDAMVNIPGANVSGVGGLVNGNGNMEPGRYGYQVNLHEFGHAMALEHPHQIDSATLDSDFDTQANTVMTYNIGAPYATDLSPFDKQALVHLYGSVDLVAGWQVTVAEDGSLDAVGSDRSETMIAVDRAARLDAGLGNDMIFGREWQDTLIVGADADTFVFETTVGYIKVVVEYFEQGSYHLDYTAFAGTGWADVQQFDYESGAGVLVYVDTGHPSLLLTGISQGSILETDFIFA